MRSGKFLILFAAALFVAVVLAVCLSPFLVAGGVRLWAAQLARQGKLQIELGKIEAPFLSPVIIHNLHITSDPAAPFRVDAATSRLELDLNLPAVFRASDNRTLRALRTRGITVDIRRNPEAAAPPQRLGWPLLHNFLADSFELSGVELHVENGETTFDLHNGALTGSELEAGTFTAREIAVASPWFYKSFSNLRGAISWQDSRLLLGALAVMPGLDVDTVTVDLSQLGQSRLAMEMNLDAFGGKIRARISSDDHDNKRTWDVAGSASEISLAQMSDSLEWANRSSGSLRASKFTFRGEVNDLQNATAAVWAEVTGVTWRDRTADSVMIGASLFNREVQIEQLYIKQRNNQFTLNGDFALPEKPADWLKPAFRGDISASLNDLGDFARLFGWSPSDFSGTIAVQGKVSTRDQKLTGQLSASGNSLILFRSPVEQLEVKLGLEESRLTISQLELRQQSDFLRGEGTFELAGEQSYNASFQTSVAEIGDYAGLIPRSLEKWTVGGSVAAEWTGRGKDEAYSGKFHVRGTGLHPLESSLIPFDAEFDGDYSPANIFFRQFHLWNPQADFSAYVDIAKDYFQVQDLRFDLKGLPRLRGNIFLPVSSRKILDNSSWLASLGPDPFLDVNLALDAVDLAEFAAAVQTKPSLTGQANGQFQLSGIPGSLQGKVEFHLRDFVADDSPALTADLETTLALGMANFKAMAVTKGSDPVKAEGAVPLKLQKRDDAYAVVSEGPVSASLTFPLIFLGTLPPYLSGGAIAGGILGGSLTISNSLLSPRIMGNVSLLEGKLVNGFSISGSARFDGTTGQIDHADFWQNNAAYSIHGRFNFSDLTDMSLVVFAGTGGTLFFDGIEPQPGFAVTPVSQGDCVSALEFSPIALPNAWDRATQIELRGNLFAGPWTISLTLKPAIPSSSLRIDLSQSFNFCSEDDPAAKVLTFGKIGPALNY